MMHPAARPLAWTLAAFTVSLFALGCSDLPVDTSMPVVTPDGPSAQRSFAVAVTCTASVAEGSIACARPSPSTGTFGPNFLIVGGQDEFVRLTSSNVSYDGGAELFQADVTVTNLFGQPLGTTDAVTSTGVRVFFHDGPTVTSGTGIVTVANADGMGAFTGSDQPFHLYDQILWTNIASTAKTWEWNVPATATTFTFEVYVEGDVVFPNGWVVVTPHPIGVQTGASVQLSATILDVVTRAVPGTLTWSSPADTIAAVDANGLVDGIAPGVVDIVASNGGPQADGSARVTVIGNGFDITLRAAAGTQDPSPSVLAAFVNAKARWESVVTGDLQNHLVQQPAVSCAPVINEVIDDLLIIVYVDTIDGPGNVLGQAGPCWLRTGGPSVGMPLTGIMEFDIEDIEDLDADGLLEDVIVHEMGHVLGIGIAPGFGILWDNFLVPSACDDTSVDPYFDGTFAVAAFDAAGGTGYTGNKVPVEDTGLEGTICSHWRESVFANEMMTGWIDPTYNPLSAITVASLADIGYTVDASGADPYTLPSGAGAALRTGGIAVNNDIRRGPLYMVDEQGRVSVIAAPAPRR
jgi:hypothetical protein